MRILLIWPYFYPNPTAATVRGCAFARYLQKLGIEIEVISPLKKSIQSKEFYNPNLGMPPIKIHRIPMLMDVRDTIKLPFSMLKLKRLTDNINPDLIIASSTPATITWQASKVAQELKIPFIMDVRDPYAASLKTASKRPFRHKLAAHLEKQSLKKANLIFTVTETLKNMLIDSYNICNEKIKLVPNGTIKEDIQKSQDIKFNTDVIFLGSIDMADEKEALVLTFKKVIKDYPKVKITLLGWKEREEIKQIRDCFGQNIKFIPPVPSENVYSYLLKSKIGIICLKDFFKYAIGAKVYEYTGAGLPIIALGPSQGELKKFVEDNKIGFYSTIGNGSAAENIIKLLRDDELWQKFHSNALKIAKKYERKKIVQDAFKKYIKPLLLERGLYYQEIVEEKTNERRKITIVLNVYNAEEIIEEFLNSLAKQTFTDFHLLIVDDGSTDATVKKIKGYKDRYDMTIYMRPHQGLRKARKFGIEKAEGNISIILDADLLLDKDVVKELIDPFKDKNVGGVSGYIKCKEGNPISEAYGALREFFYKLRIKGAEVDWVQGGFCALRTEIINLAGGYPSVEISEDIDISWRIKKVGYKIVMNKKAIAYHKEPNALVEIWKREKNIGSREYGLMKEHLKKSLKIKRLLRFYPISLPFIIPALMLIFWPLLVILSFISYGGILFVVKGSFRCKNASWLVFNTMNFAYTTGFFSALFKNIIHRKKKSW